MKEIEMVRGTTKILNITITNNGTQYIPKSGDRVLFGAKRCNKPGNPQILKAVTVAENGTAQIKINPEDTIDLCCDNYSFDIGLETEGDFFNIVEESPLRIKNNITRKGAENG